MPDSHARLALSLSQLETGAPGILGKGLECLSDVSVPMSRLIDRRHLLRHRGHSAARLRDHPRRSCRRTRRVARAVNHGVIKAAMRLDASAVDRRPAFTASKKS